MIAGDGLRSIRVLGGEEAEVSCTRAIKTLRLNAHSALGCSGTAACINNLLARVFARPSMVGLGGDISILDILEAEHSEVGDMAVAQIRDLITESGVATLKEMSSHAELALGAMLVTREAERPTVYCWRSDQPEWRSTKAEDAHSFCPSFVCAEQKEHYLALLADGEEPATARLNAAIEYCASEFPKQYNDWVTIRRESNDYRLERWHQGRRVHPFRLVNN